MSHFLACLFNFLASKVKAMFIDFSDPKLPLPLESGLEVLYQV
jgi:hypothetical protein